MGQRLLLLTASTGAGHLSASRALREFAEQEGYIVEEFDCMNLTGRAFRSWFKGGYELLVRRFPAIWKFLYVTSDRPGVNFAFQTLLDWVFMSQLEHIVKRFQPAWVVCTHSVPQPRLASIRKRYSFRMAVVVTDLYPHRMWLRGKPDLYLLPTDQSLKQLRARVGSGPAASVTGIPVGARFRTPKSTITFDQTIPMVLLSAGGIGAGPVVEATQILADLALPMRLIVLCGSNLSAYDELCIRYHRRNSAPVEVIPKSLLGGNEVASLMHEARFIIGKSGGLTTFEALACSLPFVVLDPFLIPGQEELNAAYLVDNGCGARVSTLADLSTIVSNLIQDEARLKTMRTQASSLAKPFAASEVILLLGQPTEDQRIPAPIPTSGGQRCHP